MLSFFNQVCPRGAEKPQEPKQGTQLQDRS